MMSERRVGVIVSSSKTPLRPVAPRPWHRSQPVELVRSLGKTSLVVTHRLEEAIELADRALVMGPPGRILAEMRTTPSERRDPGRRAELRRELAESMEAGERRTT
jgi:NitT/TauT family transport system ATP-binding protein